MKKSWKFVSALLAVLFLIAIIQLPVFAILPESSSTANIEVLKIDREFDNTFFTSISNMVQTRYAQDTTTIGDPLVVYNTNTNNVFLLYPIFVDAQCIAMVHAMKGHGSSIVSDTRVYQAVHQLSPGKYMLYRCNATYYAETQDHCYPLFTDTCFFTTSTDLTFTTKSFENKLQIIQDKLVGTYHTAAASVTIAQQPTFITTPMYNAINSSTVFSPYVFNTCNITNFVAQGSGPLCWAACTATILNFKNGSNYTSYDIPSMIFPEPENGGSVNEVIRVLSSRGVTGYQAIFDIISWDNVVSCINSQNPIYMGCMSFSNDGNDRHAILAYGYAYMPEGTPEQRIIGAWDPRGFEFSFSYIDHEEIWEPDPVTLPDGNVIEGFILLWDRTAYKL